MPSPGVRTQSLFEGLGIMPATRAASGHYLRSESFRPGSGTGQAMHEARISSASSSSQTDYLRPNAFAHAWSRPDLIRGRRSRLI